MVNDVRKKRNRRKLTAPPPQPAEAPWYKKTWFRVAAATSLVSWLLLNGPTAIDNVQVLPSKIQSTYAKVVDWYHTDSVWTAKWTNEGEIDARYQPDIYVGLDVLVYDDAVSGSITSSKFPKGFPLDSVLIQGEKVSGNKIRFEAFDYVGGLRTSFAKFEAEIVSGKVDIRLIWQAMPIFPSHAELWKESTLEMADMPRNLRPTLIPQPPRHSVNELQYRGGQ